MTQLELLNQLFITQQVFYIRISTQGKRVHAKEFIEDCNDPCGWKIRRIRAYSVEVIRGDNSMTRNNSTWWSSGLDCYTNGDFIIELNYPLKDLSNKGRPNCWKCQCKTEMKRDFNDMSIHEFCPRCKI